MTITPEDMTSTISRGRLQSMNTSAAHTLAELISARRTTKRFLNPANRHQTLTPLSPQESDTLQQMLETAGQAPFHKPADTDTHRQGSLKSPVPWRFHVLEPAACVALVDWLEQQASSDTPPWARAWSSKIPTLLSAAGACVMVTWLPNPGSEDHAEFTHGNIEHVAAAGAAVQNLLLMAEAAGWDSYWSSGGALREPDTFKTLGISPAEKLLGAIMLCPRERLVEKTVPGGLYDQRGDVSDWTQRVSP